MHAHVRLCREDQTSSLTGRHICVGVLAQAFGEEQKAAFIRGPRMSIAAAVTAAATAFAGYFHGFSYSDFNGFYHHHLGDLIAPGCHRVPGTPPHSSGCQL